MNSPRRLWFLVVFAVITLSTTMIGGTIPKIQGFIPNHGQWPSEVRYVMPTDNLNIWVTETGIVFDQFSVNDATIKGHVLRLTWQDANPLVQSFAKESRQETKINMFTSSSPGDWRSGLGLARWITFPKVWDGVDLVMYIDDAGRFRYDFAVKPNADAARIGFKVDGDMGMNIGTESVSLKTSVGDINMTDLYAYVLGKKSMQIPATFTAASSSVKFSVPQWSGDVPLRIDPVVYGTYIGGTDNDDVCAIRNRELDVVIAGTTSSIAFPAEVGAYEKTSRGQKDVFIAVLSKDLSKVLSYSYYGGSADDIAADMVLDKDGRPCFTGTTESENLPVSSGAVGQLYKEKKDVFIAQLSADLSELNISTYLGGNKDDFANAVAVDRNGSIFVAGMTLSDANFPTTLAHQQNYGGNEDAFIAKLSPNGGSFNFCTYFGKAGNESFTCMALDDDGSPFVSGYTTSTDFETAPVPGRWGASGRVPYDRSYNGGETDAFLVKFFSDGTLSKRDDGTFSTFFGGDQFDEGRAIYVDGVGRPVVVGITTSTNLPTEGGLQVTPLGRQDIFMVMFLKDGRGIVSCTYFGGTGDDDVFGMAADKATNSGFIFGTTRSSDFPTTGAGSVSDLSGTTDGFLAQINTATIVFSTLLGGVGPDTVVAIDVDENEDVYYSLAGPSPDLPTHDGAWQPERSEGLDGYIAKWAMGVMSMSAPNGGEEWCIGSRRTVSWSKIDMGSEDTYIIDLSADQGITWDTIATDLAGNSYSWDIAGFESGNTYIARVWSNRGHAVQSKTFSLIDQPSITTQPESVNGCEGGAVTLRIKAAGQGLSYQWKRNGQVVAGATNDSLEIAGLTASTAGSYSVDVSGKCQPKVVSKEVFVDMNLETSVKTQPEDVTVATGKSASLSVEALGGELKYQWSHEGVVIEGATEATYTIAIAAPSDSGKYICTITGTCGDVTTREAVVTVGPATSVDEDDVVERGITILGPIPASESVAVRIATNLGGEAVATVRDLGGSLAMQYELGAIASGSTDHRLPVNSLASGVYILEINIGSQTMQTMLRVAR